MYEMIKNILNGMWLTAQLTVGVGMPVILS